MPPSKWDDEEEDTPPSSPPLVAARRSKFDDEEEDDDVLESWDAAEDSEVEREKAKKAEEAKAKAEAEKKASHKSKSQRIEERRQENMRRRMMEGESEEEEEDEAERRARLRKSEQDSDLKHAEDLFGSIGISNKRAAGKAITVADDSNPNNAIDLSSLSIFNPNTKDQFTKLRETLTPLIAANAKKAQYTLFLQEFTKQIAKELPSDQIKKIASGLTTLSNEKMKEEKAAEKGGKKSKAAKTKSSLNASRDVAYKADTATYDDDFGE
ncbi:translation initiation factor eIF3 subunit [Corynespora cassiicola Philippines]|uniref:Eukaryotic translation initiation factor 3 subunit J n=1 Tax=Corynespora cassiicola Philippines TaxID=1448308 RepID=A0A2T2N4M8_CORCC|nr:translation initiation factor eIF3 subunit [Corynespora cassiicola Philippines]